MRCFDPEVHRAQLELGAAVDLSRDNLPIPVADPGGAVYSGQQSGDRRFDGDVPVPIRTTSTATAAANRLARHQRQYRGVADERRATLASAGRHVPTTWSMVGQRDFNGDGKADLLWRDTAATPPYGS